MKTNRILLLITLFLAAFLRLENLENVPPPFNVDEAVNAYDAYSILKTGKDQWGNVLPVTFRAFNDYRRPATIYSAVPFIAIFNLTIFAIRAVAAFWGWWAVVFIYRLVHDMFGLRTALLAALLFTLSPWHIAFSRLGMEVSGPLLTSIIAGIDFGWRWSRTRKDYWLFASGAAFSLSLYAYTVAQAFTPLMLLTLTILFWSRLRSNLRIALFTGVLVVLLVLPLGYVIVSNPLSWNRLDKISVLKAPYTSTIPIFLSQWAGHFTPGYLFNTGDTNPIHHPPGSGQLLWIEAIFVPLGILRMILAITMRKVGNNTKQVENRQSTLKDFPTRACITVIVWVVLGALPAALTKQDMGSANSMRGILSLPAWITISSIGLETAWWLLERYTSRLMILRILLLTTVLFNSIVIFKYYFISYPEQHARAFEYGIQQAMEYALEHEEEYNKIYLTNWISQPHIFAVFFSRYEPYEFQQNHAEYGTKLSEKLRSWGEKYETGDVEKLFYEIDTGLLIVRPHMLPDIEPEKIIYHPDGSIAFKIVAK